MENNYITDELIQEKLTEKGFGEELLERDPEQAMQNVLNHYGVKLLVIGQIAQTSISIQIQLLMVTKYGLQLISMMRYVQVKTYIIMITI